MRQVLRSAMDYGTVRIVLEKAVSSPAEVDLPKLDDAVEARGTIRRLDRGAYRLRQLLAHRWFAGTAASAQRVLMLLGREISLPGVESSTETN
jgi:hypothetical protein